MNIKAFFVDALTSALDLGIGTPDDVVRHVTPDVLALHLPRPLWARLITACLGAPRVDAALVVETIGIPNLCEHIPSPIIWACIAELGARSLGKAITAPAPFIAAVTPLSTVSAAGSGPVVAARPAVLAPPPDERPPVIAPAPPPPVLGPSIPAPAITGPEALADMISEVESGDAHESRGLRNRPPAGSRFRPSNTSSGRLGAARRPSAPVVASPTVATRRGQTEVESEIEPDPTMNRSEDELVDWPVTEGAGTSAVDDDFSDLGRKR